MGRRIKKSVSSYSTGVWTADKEILFVYDGWNLVEEITTPDGGSAASKYYVWGLDLSKSLQGAGGVGGLLAVIDGANTYQYCYDGNGNVTQLINNVDGAVAAHYEYDPYGKTIASSGAYTNNNYRFSTKYYDDETDLHYYGYRYYSAGLGKWLSRDPIEEEGGHNLLAFVKNSPVNFIDLLGNDRMIYGYPVGRPWVEFRYRKIYAGKRKFLREGNSLSSLIGKYEWKDVYWVIDYEVSTTAFFGVQISGPSTRGEIDDSAPLLYGAKDIYAKPNIGLMDRIIEAAKQNRYFRCRKKVICCTNCECGKNLWKESWEPILGEDKYLYGKLLINDLAGQPYCDLLPYEKFKMKSICTSTEALFACLRRDK